MAGMNARAGNLFDPAAVRGSRAFWVLVWLGVATAAMGQRVMERTMSGVPNPMSAMLVDLWLLAMWAGATPLFVRGMRRFPIAGAARWRNLVIHLGIASTFIVATNVVIRVPMLFLHRGAIVLVRDLLRGLVTFGPMALLVYAAIIVIAHAVQSASATGDAGDAGPTSPPACAVGAPDEHAMLPEAAAPPSQVLPERVLVRAWNRTLYVRPAEIVWAESDGNYVVVQAGSRTYKGRGRISDLAGQLDPARFVRVHRSAIVRVASVREVQPLPKGDLALVLDDGKTVRVARSRKRMLEERLAEHCAMPDG